MLQTLAVLVRDTLPDAGVQNITDRSLDMLGPSISKQSGKTARGP